MGAIQMEGIWKYWQQANRKYPHCPDWKSPRIRGNHFGNGGKCDNEELFTKPPPLLYCHNWLNSSNPGNWFKGIFSSNICIIFLSYWYKYTQQHDHGGDDERLMKDSLMMEPLRRQWLPLHLLCLSIVWDLSGIWAAPVNIWNIWTIFIIVRTRYFTDNVFNTLPDDLNFWRIRIHLSTPPMYGTSRVAVEKKIMIIPSRPLPYYVLKPKAAN